jgi:hypothetical protein
MIVPTTSHRPSVRARESTRCTRAISATTPLPPSRALEPAQRRDTERRGVPHPGDHHDAAPQQPQDPGAGRSARHPDLVGQLGVRHPRVPAQQRQQPTVQVVEIELAEGMRSAQR